MKNNDEFERIKNMVKFVIGLVGGLIGATINMVLLLLAPDLETQVFLSTAITWIAIGILISACSFKINGAIKGIAVAILVSASSLVYTAAASLSGAIWTITNTVIMGAIIGFTIEKMTKIMQKKSG